MADPAQIITKVCSLWGGSKVEGVVQVVKGGVGVCKVLYKGIYSFKKSVFFPLSIFHCPCFLPIFHVEFLLFLHFYSHKWR